MRTRIQTGLKSTAQNRVATSVSAVAAVATQSATDQRRPVADGEQPAQQGAAAARPVRPRQACARCLPAARPRGARPLPGGDEAWRCRGRVLPSPAFSGSQARLQRVQFACLFEVGPGRGVVAGFALDLGAQVVPLPVVFLAVDRIREVGDRGFVVAFAAAPAGRAGRRGRRRTARSSGRARRGRRRSAGRRRPPRPGSASISRSTRSGPTSATAEIQATARVAAVEAQLRPSRSRSRGLSAGASWAQRAAIATAGERGRRSSPSRRSARTSRSPNATAIATQGGEERSRAARAASSRASRQAQNAHQSSRPTRARTMIPPISPSSAKASR